MNLIPHPPMQLGRVIRWLLEMRDRVEWKVMVTRGRYLTDGSSLTAVEFTSICLVPTALSI
ncbi:hypothetical protein SDJN02_15430, partial [Cucurbita argyrosperma subsp. argyrosperma]